MPLQTLMHTDYHNQMFGMVHLIRYNEGTIVNFLEEYTHGSQIT